jgi:hypothetical protein
MAKRFRSIILEASRAKRDSCFRNVEPEVVRVSCPAQLPAIATSKLDDELDPVSGYELIEELRFPGGETPL